ncbi:MAG: cytochrome b/b6 domain-containing protein [Alphaproteobacteria bacterium]|nr:cytochrome b/b6 domain-containing protein [Alphaproteobacteria bacterium]
MTQDHVHYDRSTIVLHWLTALLVTLLWLGGQTIDVLGRDVAVSLRSLHITLGITLAVVLAIRVSWRLSRGRSLPDAESGVLQAAARVTHYVLYLAAGATIALGLTAAYFRGDVVFGLLAFPGGARDLGRTIKGYHALAANFVLILAGLHAAAALFHHYVLRDGVLRRMFPSG